LSRLDRDGMIEALRARFSATDDPDGVVDLIADKGRINVAANAAEIKPAIDRLRPLEGYRWLAINTADLFAANPLSIGTKVGIMDPTGKVLKAADLPRKR
jgi:hypothetical protein